MNFPRFSAWGCAVVAVLGGAAFAPAARAQEMEAIASRVSPDYARVKADDGSFVPESYAFGRGGYWGGATRDTSIDDTKFEDVAKAVAIPLAVQNYLPTKDPKAAKLLIMVYWGATTPPERASDRMGYQNASVANQRLAQATASRDTTAIQTASAELEGWIGMMRAEDRIAEKTDAQNASMLGFDSWWETAVLTKGTSRDIRWRDLLDELEDQRYFVVLMAYDFQLLWKEKKRKLVWETRLSIRAHGHDFDKALPGMVLYAGKYFGQDSHGLQRRDVPVGKVTLGELKVVDGLP